MRWRNRNTMAPCPCPWTSIREQVQRQSIRNIQVTREQLMGAMGHLILPA